MRKITNLAIFLLSFSVVSAAAVWGINVYVTHKIVATVTSMTSEELQNEVNKTVDSLQSNSENDRLLKELSKDVNEISAKTSTSSNIVENSSQQPSYSSVRNTESGKNSTSADVSASVQSLPSTVSAEENKITGLPFKNQSEATKYALKKFSATEITHYLSLYQNKNNLTKEEKDKLRAEILSRFTADEKKALLEAVNRK